MKVFKDHYASLCNRIINIDELLKYFVLEKIISSETQQEIYNCTSLFQKNSKLLLHVSGPLEVGDSKGFYTLLKIMKSHGVDDTQRLADWIFASIEASKLG